MICFFDINDDDDFCYMNNDYDDLSNLLCISVVLVSDVKLKNISSMAHLTIINYVNTMIISSLITSFHYAEVIVVEYMLL